MAPLAVELKSITKRFKEVVANQRIDLRVERGSIHGIVGENGAGKSTAMKILYGQLAPDEGEIWIDGARSHWSNPSDAIRAGIGMVHQHFMLAGPETALDNILLGAESRESHYRWLPRSLRLVDRVKAKKNLQALAERYGLAVDWDTPIERLPVGIQQRIEILKLLYRDAKILILDEPTAVLTPQEVTELFANLRRLKSEGKTILIITHKLREVIEFTDQVTVFRGGRVTGQIATRDATPQKIADLMVGRSVVLKLEVPPQPPLGQPTLRIKNVSIHRGRHRLDHLSLEVRSGEIVGIAGVEGNGQSELIQAILHPTEPECRQVGTVEVLGHEVTEWSTQKIRDLGVGLIPEDRHHEGLLLLRPLWENFALGLQRSRGFRRGWVFYDRQVQFAAARALDEYDVRPRSLDIETGRMSGGNQQKLIIAREFERRPKLLIAAQPTRGVDVGAIEAIHQRLLQARTEGAGVLLISSELDEILALSDRILVLYSGQVVAEMDRYSATEQKLGLAMGGGRS